MNTGKLEEALSKFNDVLANHERSDPDLPQSYVFRAALKLLLAPSEDCALYREAMEDKAEAKKAADENPQISLPGDAAMDTAIQLAEGLKDANDLKLVQVKIGSPVAKALAAKAEKEKLAAAKRAQIEADVAAAREKVQAAIKLKDAGNAFVKKKDYKKAIEKYTEGLAQDPKNYTCFSNRSMCNFSLKLYAEALLDAESCIEARPDFNKGYVRKATALQALGKPLETVLAAKADGISALEVSSNKKSDIDSAVAALKTMMEGVEAKYPKASELQD